MQAVILAAGYGTRLKEIAKDKPKALLQIGDKTILDRLVENIMIAGIKKVVIVTNNKFYNLFKEWERNCKNELEIKIINDGTNSNEERLGAVRDLQLAIEDGGIDEDILILGSDNVFKFEIKDVLREYDKHKCIMNVVIKVDDIEQLRKMGIVCVDGENNMIDFEEKPQNPKSNLVSSVVYIYPFEKFVLIKEYLENKNDPEGIGRILECHHKTENIKCFVSNESWFDVGSVEIYNKIKDGI